MRFQLIDRITSLVPNESITAVKNVSIAEEYLAIIFRVFQCCRGFHAGGIDSDRCVADACQHRFFLQHDSAEGNQGSEIQCVCGTGRPTPAFDEGEKIGPQHWEFAGSGVLASTQESAVSARIVLTQFNVADRDPSARASDEARIAWLRQLFPTLWSAAPAGQELVS